jgi:tetratricopeptide (TPR) repeat protein
MQPTSILRFSACISLWLFITAISHAAPTDNAEKITDLQRDVAVIKDTTTLRLEAQKDALQKDLQSLQAKIDHQDKRIGDISAETGRLSVVAALLSLLITLIVAVFGFLSWANAGTKAREVAKDWIDKHGGELTSAADDTKAEVEATGRAAIRSMNDSAAKVEATTKEVQAALSAGKLPTSSPEQIDTLRAEDERLKKIPEIQYKFADWKSRAFAAVTSENLEEAAHFFLQASSAKDALPPQVAASLLNRGIALGSLKRNTDAIKVFDDVIARFNGATELALRKPVAIAMNNKGVLLSNLGHDEDAIKVYDGSACAF